MKIHIFDSQNDSTKYNHYLTARNIYYEFTVDKLYAY